MKSLCEKNWCVTNEISADEIKSALETVFDLDTRVVREVEYRLFDDPDWSLWRSDAIFLRTDGGRAELQRPRGADSVDKISRDAKHWWDFPEGHLRDELKSRIKLRALTFKSAMKVSRVCHNVLNRDGKIVVRVKLTFVHGCGDRAYYYLGLSPLRGYDKEFAQVQALLQPLLDEHHIQPAVNPPDLKQLFIDSGVSPPVEEDKTFGIVADEPAEKAIRNMSRLMVQRALRQKNGIVDDIDTEFLHQYRVNLRKARSLLSLTRKTLLAEKFVSLKEELAELAGATNALRDMDVFLLDEATYGELLPGHYDAGLTEFFKLLKRQRKSEHKRVAAFLGTRRFAMQAQAVGKELSADPDFGSAESRRPVKKLAQTKILSRYVKICRLAHMIHKGVPDDDIHAIRIECKKLRYLMEFFAELLPRADLGKLLRRLKKLQNILGRFNDYSVQQLFLSAYTNADKYSREMIAAVNALIGVLHHKQRDQRRKVEAALADFANDLVRSEFESLFKRREAGLSV